MLIITTLQVLNQKRIKISILATRIVANSINLPSYRVENVLAMGMKLRKKIKYHFFPVKKAGLSGIHQNITKISLHRVFHDAFSYFYKSGFFEL